MLEMKRENIIRVAKAKFDAGQDIIAVAMARPAKTVAEAEAKVIKLALARAARKEAEEELELLVHGVGEEPEVVWHRVEDGDYPPYYTPIWCYVEGASTKPFLGEMYGRSHPARLWRKMDSTGFSAYYEVTHWAPCVAPKI